MPRIRTMTAALALCALGIAAPALADEHAADRAGEHTQPTHTQGSHSDTDTGGSAQVPNTRDGAEKTNPYDEAGPDDMNTDNDAPQAEDSTINE